MNLTSLTLWLALCGQLQPRASDALGATAAAADVDSDIEAADDKPTIDSEPEPAAPSPQGKAGRSPPAVAEPAQAGRSPPAEVEDGTADKLTPMRNVPTNASAPDTLLEWLAQADASLAGKRLAMVELLSRIYDRGQQAVVIPAYWKLAAAEYEYRIAADESSRLEQLLPPADASGKHPSEPLLEARLAAAEARLREAELAAMTQQHALADLMHLPASEPLPLAGDLPHAGAYRTYFQERYVQVAPPRAHLIDRTLPLLHRSIELRASAAVSAADSAGAGAEALHAGQLDVATAVEGIAELSRQRRAFVAAVRDYNIDIADYALSVVPAGLTSAQLVSILIGPPATAQRAAPADAKQATRPSGGVNPAAFNAPLFAPAGQLAPAGQPTLAPMRPLNLPAARESTKPPPSRTSPPRRGMVPSGVRQNHSGDVPGRIKSTPPSQTSRRDRAAPRYVAAKPPVDDTFSKKGTSPMAPPSTADQTAADQGLFTALGDLTPVKRAQELSATLHWVNAADGSSEPLGLPATLLDALQASAGLDRRSVVQAYWRTCEQWAAFEISKQEAELLAALQSAALGMRSQPGGAEAMLHLRTSQLAAEAAAVECQAGLLDAQFALAQLMRRPLEGPWPLPITPPHAGGYRLKLDAQTATVLQNSAVRQITTSLPLEHEALQARANAVVAADAARVDAVHGFEGGHRPLHEAVSSVRYLIGETLAFLDTQTTYNLAFADYVLAVAPAGISDATLAGVLVVSAR